MKDSSKKQPEQIPERQNVVARNIVSEMRDSYLDYAMSVITSRALPDVRDGLKPVHRRILFAMHEMNLTFSAKTRKSATVVGEVLGKYHPHGDIAVYESMVKLAQDFATRYPLIIGQGNFGNIDGDGAAAHRYTEAKMSKLSGELLADIEKDTVDFRPNYDNTRKEPVVLPTRVPNLLLNGTLGIAVGMATNIAPHNLREILDATVHLIDNEDATVEDLLQFVKGPDFPTGGIIYNQKDIVEAYTTGRGGIVVRGEAEIVESKNGQFQIVITSIPYRVVKSDLMMRIADLHREKVLEGIKGLRDESAKDIRIVIELKSGTQPQAFLNLLYKHTQLEDAFHTNMVALVNGVPQTLSLKSILAEFISHRKIVIRRRTEFDLRVALDREHILLGLSKALDHIDEIIALIKKSKDTDDAREKLMKTFKFSERQANAILDMRLQKLSGLERQKIEDELAQVQALIKELKSILESPKKILAIIKTELTDIATKYGDDRRTKVVKGGLKDFKPEDLIPDEETMLVLTAGGYVKRTDPEEYRKQKRGGVGVIDLETKEEDVVMKLLSANTHADLLFFTNKGKAYQIKMYELPEGKRATKGKSIMNFLALSDDEKVSSILPMPKAAKEAEALSIIMVTERGTSKKVNAALFREVRRNGLMAITLDDGDKLVSANFVEKGDDVSVVTRDGQSIRFEESDVREMGRSAGGVRGIDLDKYDTVISAEVVKKASKGSKLLVVMANGYGKMTELSEYKTQNRGGSGIITAQVTEKTGAVIAAMVVDSEELELVAISKKSQVIRIDVKEIPTLGRQTQGVRIMRLRDGDTVASVAVV